MPSQVVGQSTAEPPPSDAPIPDEEGWPVLSAGELLLFLKFYDPVHEQLSFVGTHVALSSHTLDDLLPVLRAAKGLPLDQELVVFEEVEFETSVRFEPIGEGRTLKDAELQSGDILVFQTLPLLSSAKRITSEMMADGTAMETEHEPLGLSLIHI